MAKRAFQGCLIGLFKHGGIATRCSHRQQSTSTRVHRLGEQSHLIRPFPSDLPGAGTSDSDDFVLYEDFFTLEESKQLLLMALWKLDRGDTSRRRRRKGSSSQSKSPADSSTSGAQSLQDLFQGEYGFEEGHYDSVIHQYRETLLSSFPPPTPAFSHAPGLLRKVYDLLPTSNLLQATSDRDAEIPNQPPPGSTTHLLHLAADGLILPHVDNLEASGSVIVGVSLGAERVLRLSRTTEAKKSEGWDVTLPNGSVYIQRDVIRYSYEHSILGYDDPGLEDGGLSLVPGHRISVMVRDAHRITKPRGN